MTTSATLSSSCDEPTTSSSPRSVSSTPRSSSSSSSKRLRRQCSVASCTKVDAGGGFCVSHGGGKKCSFPGCHKGYQTGGFCRQHGGGSRCQVDGCGKVDAGKGLCRAHGGGKRCQVENCSKADVGGGFCTAHGGGKRCSVAGCTKIDQGGGKCRAHGGARRCRHEDCEQPARGGSGLCSDHGGAQICATNNCRRLVKLEDSKYCSGCMKEQLKTEDDNTIDTMQDAAMRFTALLAQSTAMEYTDDDGRLSRTTMDQFNAFVEAAEAVEANTMVFNDPLGSFSSLETLVPQTEEAARNIINDIDMPSCIENGCSKGFGGKCNCKAGCTCCARARAAERSANRDGIHAASSPAPASSVVSSSLPSPPSFMLLSRLSVRVYMRVELPTAIVRAVLKAMAGVRSVHVEPVTSTDQDNVEPHFTFALRCDPGFDVRALESLVTLGLQYAVDDQSVFEWSYKEIVLRVQDMMCPGNCGRTVINAMQQVTTVHTANLLFEDRCVIALGNMGVQQLCDAIEATGFDAVVVAETPLPKRFRLRVQDFASIHLLGNRLRDLLLEVEGVESVVVMVDRAEVLVEGTLHDACSLLETAHANRIVMVEIPDDLDGARSSPFDPAPDVKAPSGDSEHVCDVKMCPQDGCEQYMLTVAHAAALAVGWSVPGCGMSWGGECTCGESCKCKGCPQHNPLS